MAGSARLPDAGRKPDPDIAVDAERSAQGGPPHDGEHADRDAIDQAGAEHSALTAHDDQGGRPSDDQGGGSGDDRAGGSRGDRAGRPSDGRGGRSGDDRAGRLRDDRAGRSGDEPSSRRDAAQAESSRSGSSDSSGALADRLEGAYQEAVRLGFLGPREGSRLRSRHIDDALALAEVRSPRPGERWADLGSGAGLPGLPLAARYPDSSFTLIDAQQRRLAWVAATAAELGLANLTTVHGRLEDLGRGPERERFDVATARALGPLPVVAELGLPLVRVGGLLIVPRGRPEEAELSEARHACGLLGGEVTSVVPNPASPIDPIGFVVIMTKTLPTSPRFPRRPGVPARNPLGRPRPKRR
jgi:16S rRNA (guanine527-N7)-methyltransferase